MHTASQVPNTAAALCTSHQTHHLTRRRQEESPAIIFQMAGTEVSKFSTLMPHYVFHRCSVAPLILQEEPTSSVKRYQQDPWLTFTLWSFDIVLTEHETSSPFPSGNVCSRQMEHFKQVKFLLFPSLFCHRVTFLPVTGAGSPCSGYVANAMHPVPSL